MLCSVADINYAPDAIHLTDTIALSVFAVWRGDILQIRDVSLCRPLY